VIRVNMSASYNIMPLVDWDRFKGMGIDRAINTIYAISEYNRNLNPTVRPLLIPASYLNGVGVKLSEADLILSDDSPFMIAPFKHSWRSDIPLEAMFPKIKGMGFSGYVMAGGAALAVVGGTFQSHWSDIDYYPIYTGSGDRQTRIMTSYNQWLKDFDGLGLNITHVRRSERTTTIEINWPNSRTHFESPIKTHQMIHRAYRTPEEIVVGFDQPCCKAFYDGSGVYVTLDCALCIQYGINPVDWRAESPTHIKRVLKYYNRCFHWVIPKFELEVGKALRFAGGLIMNRKIKKDADVFQYELLDSRFGDYAVIINRDEFPVPVHSSAYQSDYEPSAIDAFERDGYDIPTEENQELGTHPKKLGLSNIRAAATDHPTYFIAYSLDITSFITGSFIADDYAALIDAQPYRDYYLHRKRMCEIAGEIDLILGRLRWKKTKPSRRGKGTMIAGAKPHRFDAGGLNRYATLCSEAKKLHANYLNVVIIRSAAMLKRRTEVQFVFDNPGSQITASFNPILRTGPVGYWGVGARGVDANPIVHERIAWDGIRTLCMLANRGVICVHRDILKKIRTILFDLYISDTIAIVTCIKSIVVSEHLTVGGVRVN
jgi:hypothetical protein